MSKKTNHKNLARKQARIREARRKAYHKRQLILWGVIGLVVIMLGAFLVLPMLGGGETVASDDCDTAEAPQTYSEPFPMDISDKVRYAADVKTSMGQIDLELLPAKAPNAVNNFVSLAKAGFYDCLTFHRVIDGFMIQGGDPEGTGQGGPGYSFDDELSGREKYPVGTLAMANSGPNTNGSQFFIVTGPQGESLPPSYVVFGKVTSGQDVADAISKVPVSGDTPNDPPTIESVTISEPTQGAQT